MIFFDQSFPKNRKNAEEKARSGKGSNGRRHRRHLHRVRHDDLRFRHVGLLFLPLVDQRHARNDERIGRLTRRIGATSAVHPGISHVDLHRLQPTGLGTPAACLEVKEMRIVVAPHRPSTAHGLVVHLQRPLLIGRRRHHLVPAIVHGKRRGRLAKLKVFW